jgi:hypothetical protein
MSRDFNPYPLSIFFLSKLAVTASAIFILRISFCIDVKMAIKCLDCGYIDKDNSIAKINENLVFSMGKTAPFRCVNCGSKRITSENVE